MNGPRSVLILLVTLVLGASFVLPQEDLPETAYDESESLPYEGTPVFSVALPECPSPQPVEAGRSSVRRGAVVRLQGTAPRTKSSSVAVSSRIILGHSFRC